MDEMVKKRIGNLKNWSVFLIIVNVIQFVSGGFNVYSNLTIDIDKQLELSEAMPEIQEMMRHNLEAVSNPAIIGLQIVMLLFEAVLIYYLFNFIRKVKDGRLPEVTAIYIGFAKMGYYIIMGGIQAVIMDRSFSIVFWTGFSLAIISSLIGLIIYGVMLSKYKKIVTEME